MKRLHRALGAVLMLVASASFVAAYGQVTTAPTIKLKQPKPKIDSFKGEVVNCTPVAITVRDRNDANKIRTFTFDPKLTRHMENRYMEGASKVTVRYLHMTDTAVGLKGKIISR